MNSGNEWTSDHTIFLIIYLVCLILCITITKILTRNKRKNVTMGRLVTSKFQPRDRTYEKSPTHPSGYSAEYELIIDGQKYIKKYFFNSLPESELKFYYYKSGKDAVPENYTFKGRQAIKFFTYTILPFVLSYWIYHWIF